MAFGILKHPNVKKGRPGRARKFGINVWVTRADASAMGTTSKLYARARRHGKDWPSASVMRHTTKARGYCAVAHVNRNYKTEGAEPFYVAKWKKGRGSGIKWSDTACARTPTKAAKKALASMMKRMK